MERDTLLQYVEERLKDGEVFVSRRVMAAIADATVAALVDAEQVNAKHCPACRTTLPTVAVASVVEEAA